LAQKNYVTSNYQHPPLTAAAISLHKPNTTRIFNQRTNQLASTSNYGGHGPTILTQSLLTNTDVECPAYKEKANA
jgi:hypothetical protein